MAAPDSDKVLARSGAVVVVDCARLCAHASSIWYLPPAREIGGPSGLLFIEAFFPAGQETDIVAAFLILYRDK